MTQDEAVSAARALSPNAQAVLRVLLTGARVMLTADPAITELIKSGLVEKIKPGKRGRTPGGFTWYRLIKLKPSKEMTHK